MITSLCKKSVQAINYFARKKDGKINKMKAVKLIYFADRYHLRKYGRPIVGDSYWAMKFGPVGSSVLDAADLNENKLEEDCLKYARNFLSHPKGDVKLQNVISKKEVDLDVFSQSDIEAFEVAFKEFGDKDQFELAELSHRYPEWAKHKSRIEAGHSRVRMNYADFFLNPRRDDGLDIFAAQDESLALIKGIFQENEEAEAILK